MNNTNTSTKNGTSKALINSMELTNHINQLVDLYQQKKLNEEVKILEIEQLSLTYNVPAYNLKNLFSLRIREIIIKRIDDIIDSNLTQTDLQIALQSIASDSNLNLREIKQLYDDRIKELETNWLDIGEDITDHISNFNADLDIADIVPDHLSYAIKEYSKLLSVKPVTCLMALLCGLSSCHNSSTRIWLTNSYSETPNLWGMIIGDSGTGKTPIIKTFVEEPIKPLQKKLIMNMISN